MQQHPVLALAGTLIEQLLALAFWLGLAWQLPSAYRPYGFAAAVAQALFFAWRNGRQRLAVLCARDEADHMTTVAECQERRDHLQNVDLEFEKDKIAQWRAISTYGGMLITVLTYLVTPVQNSLLSSLRLLLPAGRAAPQTPVPPTEWVAALGTLAFLIFCVVRWNLHMTTARNLRERIHFLDMRIAELEKGEVEEPAQTPPQADEPAVASHGRRAGTVQRAGQPAPAAATAEE